MDGHPRQRQPQQHHPSQAPRKTKAQQAPTYAAVHSSAYRVVCHLGALVLIHTHHIPKVGINRKYQQAEDHNAEHDAARHAVQPVGLVLVAIIVLCGIKDDLVDEEAEQGHGADVLDGDVEGHNVEEHIPWLGIHLRARAAVQTAQKLVTGR